MSVLGVEDLYREIGKNIFIYPLKIDNIKANTINLTASEYAWSIKTKKNICKDQTKIVIEPNDTALIYTTEAIYVSKKIGGTYHSKVSLVSGGLGHIGTTLDPEYMGLSLIAVHNHSNSPYELKVGATFVSIMFHYLKTPTYTISHNNIPGQTKILQNYEDLSKFEEWAENHDWINEKRKLIRKMIESNEYKEMKSYYKDLKSEKSKLLFILLHNKVTKYFLFFMVIPLAYLTYNYINSTFSLSLDYVPLVSAILASLGVLITSDLNNYFK